MKGPTMGPKLKARLAQIASMSAEELDQLIVDLTAAFDLLDDNDGSLDDLNEIANAIDSVKNEQASRTERQAVRDRVHTMSEEPAEEADVEESSTDAEETDGEDGEDDEDEEDTDAEVGQSPLEADEVVEPVAASTRPTLQQMSANVNKGKKNKPNRRVTTRVVAGGDVSGFSAGQEINNARELALATTRKLQSLGRGGSPDRILVASMIKDYPDELTLGEDAWANEAKISAVFDEAMVASGGICEPVTIDYSVDTIGSTARPLQAGLPSFNASRGGVKFNVPPSLADVVGVPETWTIADDVAAADTTTPQDNPSKTCFRIECGDSDDAFVYGIPVCLEVGNMMGRFTPEWISAQQSLLDVATARMAELELLKAIDAGSTAVTATGILGTTRTILPTLDQLLAAYNYRNRLTNAAVRIVLPDWVKSEVRADLAMEMAAHDNDANLAVSDAQIASYFSARNASIIWMLEDLANSLGGAQAAGALNPWPASFVGYVYAEGTWQ